MADYSTLTKRQQEIYDFIRDKIYERGYGPTVREIGRAFGIKSPNGVMCHLNALVKKGLIHREEQQARAIRLANHRPPAAELPLLGKVAAGTPVLVEEEKEHLNFNDLFGGKDHYALQVRGQSMIEDHIEDGDFVIIRRQDTAENGARVVAMVDNEVTLKRLRKHGSKVELLPANATMKPIPVLPGSEATILGVLVGVARKC
jgi:repressor LexA